MWINVKIREKKNIKGIYGSKNISTENNSTTPSLSRTSWLTQHHINNISKANV